MSWMLSIWVAAAAALLALCRGQNTMHEGNSLYASGYHLCNHNVTRNVSFPMMHTVSYTTTKRCGSWPSWQTCTVTLYKMTLQTEHKTVMEQVTRCCTGYVQVGHYCALPVNRSVEFTAKPGSCPTADGLCPRSKDCEWDMDCPGWQKCCQGSGRFVCSDPASPANYSDNGGCRLNVTVTVKTDYQQLMSSDGGHLSHTRLLQAMVTGALQSDVSVHYLSSQPVHPYRTATSLLIANNCPLPLNNVTSKLHLLLKHVQEVSFVSVEDVDECAEPALRQCSPQADCINTVSSYCCTCQQGYTDVDPSNPGAHCTASSSMQHPPTRSAPHCSMSSTVEPPLLTTTCSPPSITSIWSANVTGTSFCVYWSSQTNQTYQVVVRNRSEVINSSVTDQTMMEMTKLKPGVLYNVTVTPSSCGGQGVALHISVKTDAQTLDATTRLTNIQFTADLHNTSSQAYKSLTDSIKKEVYQSLSPEIKAMMDSDQVRIEIRGFSPGSVVVNISIIWVPSQSQDISNVSTALLRSLMNSTKYTVDENNTSTNDFNECDSGENDCSLWANCTNTWASYTCGCLDRFIDNNPERPGRFCQAITTTTTAPTTTTTALAIATTTPTAIITASAFTTTALTTMPSAPSTTAAPTTTTTTPTTIITVPAITTTVPTTTTNTASTTTPTAPTTTTTTQTTIITLPAITTTVPTATTNTASTTTATAPTTPTTAPTTTDTASTTTPTAPTTTTTTPTTIITVPAITTTVPTTINAALATTDTAPTTTTSTSTTIITAPAITTTVPTTTTAAPATTSTAPTTTTTAPTTNDTASTTTPTAPTTTTTTPQTTIITAPAITTTAPTTSITASTTSITAPTTTTTALTTTPSTPTTTTTAPTTIITASTTTITAPTNTTSALTTTPSAPTTNTTDLTTSNTFTTNTTTAPATIITASSSTTVPTTIITSPVPTAITTSPTSTTTASTTITTAPTTTPTAPAITTTVPTTTAPTTTTAAPTTTTSIATTTTLTSTTTAKTSMTSTPTTTTTVHTTTATAPRNATNALMLGAISVQCRVAAITVIVARDFLQRNNIRESTLYLGLPECVVNGDNDTHIQMTVAWDECGTRIVQNETFYTVSVTLFNTMEQFQLANGTVEGPRIRLESPIMCTYTKHMLLSANSGSMGYGMIKDLIMGSGFFQVTVQLMNGTTPLPHNYSLSSEEAVVVDVSLNTSSEQIKVIINKCWGTPTQNPLDSDSYPFLENSCSMNTYTEVLMNGKSSTSRVSVRIFSFVKLDMIYLHCQVQICVQMVGSDTCVPDCMQRTSRSLNILAAARGSSGALLRLDVGFFEEEYTTLQIVGFSCLGVGLSLFFIIGFVCVFYYQRNRIGHYNFSNKPKQENFTYLVFNT